MMTNQRKNSRGRETEDLKTKLQDMSVQLQNKSESINRLEEELNQFKADQSNILIYQNEYYGEYSRQQKAKKRTTSQNKSILNNDHSMSIKSFNNSNDGLNLNDMSIGSILGNLNKSRGGSNSKYDPTTDCSCGYKPRCQRYKTIN